MAEWSKAAACKGRYATLSRIGGSNPCPLSARNIAELTPRFLILPFTNGSMEIDRQTNYIAKGPLSGMRLDEEWYEAVVSLKRSFGSSKAALDSSRICLPFGSTSRKPSQSINFTGCGNQSQPFQ